MSENVHEDVVEYEEDIDEPLNLMDPDATEGEVVEKDDIHPPNEDEEPTDDLTE